MRYLLQFLLILAVSFLGELIHRVVPLPIPASVWGMAILLACLLTRVVRPEHVRETGHFLLVVMPVMFIPAGVGLLASWGVLRPSLLPVAVITLASLVTVLAVTGLTAQYLIGRKGRRRHG